MASFGSSVDAYELSLARRQTLGAALWRSAQVWPREPAVTDLEQSVSHSYADLNAWVNRTAAGLSRKGVARGTRVAVVMRNRMEFVYLYYALAKLGAVVVPLNFRLLPDEIRTLVQHAQCRHAIVDPPAAEALQMGADWGIESRLIVGSDLPGWESFARLVEAQASDEWRSEVDDHDVLGFMYTAGTTGLPKASIKTHGEYTFSAQAFLLRLGQFIDVGPRTRYLVTTPIFHGGGFTLFVTALYGGWHAVMMSAFTPDAFVTAVQRYCPTITWLVPTMLTVCIKGGVSAEAVAPLRVIISAGAPLPPSLREEAQRAWPHVTILDVLGQTEACGPITAPDSAEVVKRKPATLGKPLLGVEIAVQSLEGTALAAGERGEVCYRGPLISQGYYRNPDATLTAFRDGWFHSGDIGYLDEDGDLYLVDRVGDMMITGGENVFPSEVEDVLLSHPAVAEACVFGVPDQRWGDLITAAVVPVGQAELTTDGLIAYCRSRLAPFKCPRRVVFREALPKSPVGKILRREARQAAIAETAAR